MDEFYQEAMDKFIKDNPEVIIYAESHPVDNMRVESHYNLVETEEENETEVFDKEREV